jgi:hypothetical protein
MRTRICRFWILDFGFWIFDSVIAEHVGWSLVIGRCRSLGFDDAIWHIGDDHRFAKVVPPEHKHSSGAIRPES